MADPEKASPAEFEVYFDTIQQIWIKWFEFEQRDITRPMPLLSFREWRIIIT